jgi:hypothetical protein
MASTRAGLGAAGFREAVNPSATAAMSAATPYTMLSSQYRLAPSTPPRNMPWDRLIAPWNKVAIRTLPSVWRKTHVIKIEYSMVSRTNAAKGRPY